MIKDVFVAELRVGLVLTLWYTKKCVKSGGSGMIKYKLVSKSYRYAEKT